MSKTDTKGLIRYANEAFRRVSGYAEVELIGQPHNIVRHPDTPRGVFHLMWEHLGAGEEIFVYLNNLASDGSHYWVLAHVTPTFGPGERIVGFHSNRRSPSRRAVARVEPLYARMRAEESRHRRAADAARASAQMLVTELADQRRTYDEFVWSLINEEKAA